MKKLYVAILMLFFGVTAMAQSQKMPTPQELTVKSVDEMAERLKLNATQKSVIYNYTFEMFKTQLDLVKKQQAGNSNEDDITKFYKFQNETNNNIKTILKGDQIAEFDKLLEERLNGEPKKKKSKKGKKDKEETVTGISGLTNPVTP